MPPRHLILSDLHLGKKPASHHADLFRPLWSRGDHVIINGDCAELHDPRYSWEAVRQTLRLQEICDEDGVTLTLIAGNHDPTISPRRHVFLCDGKILVTHGDAVYPAIAPWCHFAPLMQGAFDEAMSALPVESRAQLEPRLRASQHAAETKWNNAGKDIHYVSRISLLYKPWAFVQIARYWMTFPKEAAKFTADFAPGAKFVVMGHTHHQGIWTVGERVIINSGCYEFPGRPRAVVLAGNELSVHRLQRTATGFVIKEKPMARFVV